MPLGAITTVANKINRATTRLKRVGAIHKTRFKKNLVPGIKGVVKEEVGYASKTSNMRKNARATGGVNMKTYERVENKVYGLARLVNKEKFAPKLKYTDISQRAKMGKRGPAPRFIRNRAGTRRVGNG